MMEEHGIKNPLSPDTILQSEFNYIIQTVSQAEEDRKSISSFYIVSVGTLVAAMISTRLEGTNMAAIYWAFACLLVVLSLVGLLTLLQLARLRAAWYESMIAMNQIKDYYIKRLPAEKLEEALRWRTSTLPPRSKAWSISFLFAAQVAALASTTLAGAVLLALYALGYSGWWAAVPTGIAFFAAQILLYLRLLRKK